MVGERTRATWASSRHNLRMINKCVRCQKEFEINYKCNVCDGCTTIVPGLPRFKVGINDKRWLHRGTAWESQISVAEEREMTSGVAIPKGDGKFALGRIENGKIREKPPRN